MADSPHRDKVWLWLERIDRLVSIGKFIAEHWGWLTAVWLIAHAAIYGALGQFTSFPLHSRILIVLAVALVTLGICHLAYQVWRTTQTRNGNPGKDGQSVDDPDAEELAKVAWGTEPVPMPDAAMQLYQASRSLRMQWREQIAAMNEMEEDAERNAMLDFVAEEIAKKCPIYGKHVASEGIRRINIKDAESFQFRDGAKTFRHWLYDQTPEYADITIRRADLEDLLAHVKTADSVS